MAIKLGGTDYTKGFEQLGSNISQGFKGGLNQVGYGDKPKQDQKRIDELNERRINESKGILGSMTEADSAHMKRMEDAGATYKSSMGAASQKTLGELEDLMKKSKDQASNAQTVYDTSVAPNQKDLMEAAMKNAKGAMTLEEAMDPDNEVAAGIRNLYNKQGLAARQQGLTDAGILAAMGAQATAGQLGGMPVFTGSNLATLNAQNQSQSAQAFAAAQKRMMDLQEQGLGKGIEQSNAMYDRGQLAQDSASQRVSDYQIGGIRNDENQRGFRGEQGGYSKDSLGINAGMSALNYGVDSDLSGLSHGLSTGQFQRDLGILGDQYSGQIGSIQNMMGIDNNRAAEIRKLLGQGSSFNFMGIGASGAQGGNVSGGMSQQGGIGAQGQGQGITSGMSQQPQAQGPYSGGAYGPPTYQQYQQQQPRGAIR